LEPEASTTMRHDGLWRGLDDLELATVSALVQPHRPHTSRQLITKSTPTVTTSPPSSRRREN
jgi:hypothetical protein